MSGNCWVLEGVDTGNRQRAIEEAERRGVPLGVYLTDIVARAALVDRIAPAAAAPEQEAPNAVARRESHLVEALESRFGLAVEALDGTVCGLAVRVEEAEALAAATAEQLNQTMQGAEQLRTQIADVEDNAQTAIEATAETLRQAGAALATEFAHATRETRGAIESVNHDLSVEIADVRERQAASAALIGDVTAMRQATDARAAQAEEAVRAVLARAEAEWDARHDALRADSERIEASAFAALEKVANDRAAGDAALHRELADVRDQASGALARLTLLDRAIGARDLFAEVEAGAAPLSGRLTHIEAALAAQSAPSGSDHEFDERLLRLEAAHESEATAHALAALRGQIGAVSAKFDAHEIEGAQYLDQLRAQVAAEALQNVQRRVAEFEQRQEAAVEQLRADIARFVDENARRLEALEQPAAPAIATEFDALRRRIEERILDVEQRSVRALEQAADAMVLESRFSDGPEVMLRTA